VVIVSVLSLAAMRVGYLNVTEADFAGFPAHEETDLEPEYALVDRAGRPLATFVRRLDLVLSPNALWQAHTPDVIARELSTALGGSPSPDELLQALIPDARIGLIRTVGVLDPTQSERVAAWLARGCAGERDAARPVQGFWLEPAGQGTCLVWAPRIALSEEQRRVQLPERSANPIHWTRALADGLSEAIYAGAASSEEQLAERRRLVWELLMPTRHAVALSDFDATHAPELLRTLDEQAVASHQMSIARDRSRLYPVGAFRLLGHWGWVDPGQGDAQALIELGFAPKDVQSSAQREALVLELSHEERREFEALSWRTKAQRYPASGVERLCDQLLSSSDWGFLERNPARFTFDAHRAVRGRVRSRPYFRDFETESEAPRVVSTLDSVLQRQVGRELEALMAEHRTALAMAIVIDVESGAVLALDSREAYRTSSFAPIAHEFTPGSTAKVLVMASAIEAGVVDLSERIDVGHGGEFRLPNGRLVHEAESSQEGLLTPAECLAHSVNAGMAQIGLRVEDRELYARFCAAGYGRAPDTGLGGDRPGRLPSPPWSEKYTHTSFGFGHEWLTTLWQHAAGLLSVVRGGEWIPLSLVSAVEQNGWRYPLPAPEPRRVFRPATCALVRDMMALGAREGTGAAVASSEHLPDLAVGTKTGTAQKVATELCLHLELADQARHADRGTRCSKACRRGLAQARRDHRECYTSSMAIFGSTRGGREVFVLVVAEEPRGSEKYGSKVAGPTAVAILREALGQTVMGAEVGVERVRGFARASEPAPAPAGDAPWNEEF
jgi:cell division protein FtsI/penicillin-binding protein 2